MPPYCLPLKNNRRRNRIIHLGGIHESREEHKAAELYRILRLALNFGLLVRGDLRFLKSLLFANLLDRCGKLAQTDAEAPDLPRHLLLEALLICARICSISRCDCSSLFLGSAHGISQLLALSLRGSHPPPAGLCARPLAALNQSPSVARPAIRIIEFDCFADARCWIIPLPTFFDWRSSGAVAVRFPGRSSSERSFLPGCGYQHDFAAVFGSDAMRKRKSEPRALLFSFADEGLKQAAANALSNTGPVVFHFDDNHAVYNVSRACNARFCFASSRGLARIQQQIIDRSLDLLCRRPMLPSPQDRNELAVRAHSRCVGMCMKQGHCAFQQSRDQLVRTAYCRARPAEDQHRFDEFGGAMNCRPDIAQNLVSLVL